MPNPTDSKTARRDSLAFSQPYASKRAPVCAENMVATSQPLAAEAGLYALRRGGNAVDAALATAITLTVVEPCSNGVGSDAFAIVWDGVELTGLNASGHAPMALDTQKFASGRQMPWFGWDSVTVPGAVSAWVALAKRFGRLRFEELFEAGIHYARDGFAVGPVTALRWQEAAEVYRGFDEWERHFLPAPRAGETFRRPELATSLELIAASEGEAFYRGELAEAMQKASLAGGGTLRLADLEAHSADWVQPTKSPYRHIHLHELPPNGQGIAAQIALGILNRFEAPPLDSAEATHLQVEAMKIAVRAAFDHIGDIEAMRVSVEELLDEESLDRAAQSIDMHRAQDKPQALPTSMDTVYLSAADASGMMVSFIQSNYMGFGSGIVIPGTGISLQNRGACFSLEPGHPNQVGPGKRPFHTIIPGFVTEDDQPRLSFGVMGGHMQHQGHVQMVSRIFDHGQNPQAASDAPRWHVFPDFSLGLEEGMDAEVITDLKARGHKLRANLGPELFGGAQLILRGESGYIGASDHRKEGMAVGY